MKWLRMLAAVFALAAALVATGVASAATVGTPSDGIVDRSNVDTRAHFSVLDTTQGVTQPGSITSIDYYGAAAGTIQFFVTDATNVVKYVSEEISVETNGVHVYTLPSPEPVALGDRLGYFTHGAGVIPFDFSANAVGYTPAGSGLPVVGQPVIFEGVDGRVYSFGATYSTDADSDGVSDSTDNCPSVANSGQDDLDGDGAGDACDDDVDGDGALNAADNCPAVANGDQANLDGDGAGDACDEDRDGDGVANGNDRFPSDPAESADSDGDGVGDNADEFPNDAGESADADGDGAGDNGDNCPAVVNAGQADLDGDGAGDPCDGDVDGDGVPNSSDNAPRVPNADQEDLDRDGIGDVIDPIVLPRTADQCKKNGWKKFHYGRWAFRSQFECVLFVAIRGKAWQWSGRWDGDDHGHGRGHDDWDRDRDGRW